MLVQRASRGKGAHVSAAQHGTERDDSKGFGPGRSRLPAVLALRAALAGAGLIGAVLLVVATFATIIEISVETTTRGVAFDAAQSGWDRHGPALLVVAGLALVMLVGAFRGARPAMAAVLVCGVGALLIVLAFDVPHLDDTGQVGRLYSDAAAGPRVGFWLELGGAALLCLSGAGLLLLARRSDSLGAAGRARTARRGEDAAGAGARVRDA